MEDLLEVYHLPYDPDYPVVCMDESCKQLVADIETLRSEVNVWETARNRTANQIDWQLKTENARIKLKKLYPEM